MTRRDWLRLAAGVVLGGLVAWLFRAERSVGLIDATKFGRASLLAIARAQELDAIVTDAELPAGVAEEYRAAGVRLEIANPQQESP